MYSIRGLETVFDVMAYTVKAMSKSGLMPGDIEDYIAEAVKDNDLHIIETSKDRLELCNELLHDSRTNKDWYEDSWRDHYYSSLWNNSNSEHHSCWDDDGRYDEEDEDIRSYLTYNNHVYWDDNNVIDDVESIEENEAYEGFSSCKNHYWDCMDGGHFDKMRSEDDLEPSYDPFNDPDNNEVTDDF